MLAPGAAGVRAQRSKDPAKKPEAKGLDLQKMMALSLVQGADASDMMPLLMMNYLMEDKRDRQRRRRQRDPDEGFLGGSSSEGSDADGLEREATAADLSGVRTGDCGGAGNSGRAGMDLEGLPEASALGKVQRDLSLRGHGRPSLRVSPRRKLGGGNGLSFART